MRIGIFAKTFATAGALPSLEAVRTAGYDVAHFNMSVLGGAVGLAVGVGGASLLAHFTGWSTAVHIQAVALAIGFSAAVGVFFGFYPARKAAALDPIQALRYE